MIRVKQEITVYQVQVSIMLNGSMVFQCINALVLDEDLLLKEIFSLLSGPRTSVKACKPRNMLRIMDHE